MKLGRPSNTKAGRPADMPGPERFAHGTRSRYVTGCRCAECKASNVRVYHDRQARAKAAAAELAPAPATPVDQQWTAPDGTIHTRQYRRACPGVEGKPCPKRSHLRKDSKGGCCGTCRERLVWNGLVDVGAVRRHLRKLSRKSVGYKSVADAADVSRSALAAVLTGQKRQIRRQTEKRILAVTAEAVADHGIIDGAKTWELLNELLDRGFRKAEIARRLGMRTPALQIRSARVLARTAYAVARLHRMIGAPPAPIAAPVFCACARPVIFELDAQHYCGTCDELVHPNAVAAALVSKETKARER